MRLIILACLLFVIPTFADEIKERNDIIKKAYILYMKSDFLGLDKMSADFLKNKSRTSSGKWKHSLFYMGIERISNIRIKDKVYWNTQEEKALRWISKYPLSSAAHITYAHILENRAWSYRGTKSAKLVEKEQFEMYYKFLKKAKKYLNEHKSLASKDPGWYTLMLKIARDESWKRKQFISLLDEAILKYPNYNSIYNSAIEYMSPQWNHFNKIEVEKIAQKALKASGTESYARFYWVASQRIYKNDIFHKSDVNWKLMAAGIDMIVLRYPSEWNKSHLAYYSCQADDKSKTYELMKDLNYYSRLSPWENKTTFQTCKDWSNKTQKKLVETSVIPIQNFFMLEVPLSNLKKHIKDNSAPRPMLVFFSSYDRTCKMCDYSVMKTIAKKYHGKVDFISVNLDNKKIKPKDLNLLKKYYLQKVPSIMIMYKEKILLREDFINLQEWYGKGQVEKMIENILTELKNKKQRKYYLAMFKKEITDNASYFNSENNIRSNSIAYMSSKKPYKAQAAAVSIKNNTWISGRALLSSSTQEKANEYAIKDCEKKRKKWNLNEANRESCKLYRIAHTYVYEKTETEIESIMEEMSQNIKF